MLMTGGIISKTRWLLLSAGVFYLAVFLLPISFFARP
jgi:hypothetical protein